MLWGYMAMVNRTQNTSDRLTTLMERYDTLQNSGLSSDDALEVIRQELSVEFPDRDFSVWRDANGRLTMMIQLKLDI